ncbi:hypothetical protein APT58_12195 [Corynebacterium glutamicum]|nr:hypothetical protein APT58_12195 [Corynebacterium glutamicum]
MYFFRSKGPATALKHSAIDRQEKALRFASQGLIKGTVSSKARLLLRLRKTGAGTCATCITLKVRMQGKDWREQT